MKKFFALILCTFYLLGIFGCSHNEKEESLSDRRPMIMVNERIYMDTGKEIPLEIGDHAISGVITSSVKSTEKPAQNGESNFGYEGAQYALYDEGLVVLIQEKWIFFKEDIE
ncbi:hypothetical protein [Alkalihalobacterium chitinilyticum]|uniref:DUF3221 domain-containing protein n=1 Tax=Alkalihalobacterium chitinilyticum TaxID=2980103 RepID=A0ABT5VIH9_9BACI|nr:hypothetical protein [Alkalihalobacterium chitinilyticum]MDE5415256.1 hypothetical protein [Alkalihalobacterium chitinilyticum]